MKLVHVVSLGCPKARVDTEVMISRMREAGYEVTKDPDQADAIVVNTCSFLQSAVNESIDTILEMADYKSNRCDNLIVTGCLPSRYGDELVNEMPEVDTFLGTGDLHRIGEALQRELPNRAYIREGSYLYEDHEFGRVQTTRGASSYLKLAEGCNRTCTFCIIPQIRGKQRSRPIPDVVEEARLLAAQGMKELVLVAQDLTSYGVDLGDKRSLVQLIDQLEEVEGIEWIRMMYCYPWNFTDELLERLQNSDKLLRYVDMPLQHINGRILKDMRRNVQRKKQVELLRRLRQIDDMVIRTTFITGFPGETDSEFQELVDWVQEVEFDRVGVFPYSPEPGTPAGEREDQVDPEVSAARRDTIMEIQQEIHARKLESMVGREVDVLVDGPSQEHPLVLEGRYHGQAPEIDGVTYLSFDDGGRLAMPGDIVRVRIEETADYDLLGVITEHDTASPVPVRVVH